MKEQEPLLNGVAAEPVPGCCAQCCGCCCGSTARKVWLSLIIFSAVVLSVLEYHAHQWQAAYLTDLASYTKLANTSLGKIEYFKNGSAPYVLAIHGEMNGWDFVRAEAVSGYWYGAGYGIISPSRACYLRTECPHIPFTPEQQADQIAELLDELGVSKVLVFCGSGCGPVGINFAARHSGKAVGMVLYIAITKSHKEPQDSPMHGLDSSGYIPPSVKFFVGLMGDPLISWLTYQMLQSPSAALDSALGQMSNYSAADMATEKARILANKTLSDFIVQLCTNGGMPLGPRLMGQVNDCCNYAHLDLPYSNIKCPVLSFFAKNDSPEHACPTAEMMPIVQKRIPHAEVHLFKKAWHIIWVAPEWDWAIKRQIEFARNLKF